VLGAVSSDSSAGASAATPAKANQQAPGFYRYKVGEYQITAVTDGVSTYPIPDGFVTNASKAEISAALAAAYLDPEQLSVPYTPIVVNTGAHLAVIDTGTGEGNFATSKGAAGQFQRNLRAAGFTPEAVDVVIISHFHGDHVNGLLTADGKLAFPNATVMVPEKEWAFWMDDGEMSRAPKGRMEGLFKNNRRVFDALNRKVTPYAWEKDVLPGIKAVGTPGHTPGHTSYVISSGKDQVFVQSDVTNLPALFARNPGWHPAFDQDGVMAEATRRRVYDMVAAERMLIQGFHYPFPGAAYLEKTSSGYREIPRPWMPVV
jgi:glyoxylase-like metal-dependent hydrolase (beta-lactamase superfamily II)